MKTIYKYELTPKHSTSICEPVIMPHDAKYLYTDSQNDKICLWAEVDTTSSVNEHLFEVFGTGHEMVETMGVEREYIDSLMMYEGKLVFHVYHRKN